MIDPNKLKGQKGGESQGIREEEAREEQIIFAAEREEKQSFDQIEQDVNSDIELED